jgi:hypothetical protein
MPTIELRLETSVRAAAAPDDPLSRRFRVASAGLAASQPGRLPPSAAREIAKLGGSTIEFASASSGAALGVRLEVAGGNPDLAPLMIAAGDALSSIVLPYPEEPVGSGAFWMVKSRETCSGADVMAYRMVKVDKLEAGAAQLSVETRRYLAGESVPLDGLPPHHVRQFQSQGTAQLSLVAGQSLPIAADLRDSFVAVVTPDDRPNQALPVQSELTGRLSFERGRAQAP